MTQDVVNALERIQEQAAHYKSEAAAEIGIVKQV